MIKQPKDYYESERVDAISKMDDIKALKEELEVHKQTIIAQMVAIAGFILLLLILLFVEI